jgi:hypothetical protein
MSYTGKYVSLKTIVDRVYSNFEINYSFTYNDAAEWVGNLLANLQAGSTLEDKVQCIKIHEGRGQLPCDLESITQVAKIEGCEISECSLALFSFFDKGTFIAPIKHLDTVERTFEYCACDDGNTAIPGSYKLIPMRWSTDNFHYKFHNNIGDYQADSEYSYKLNRGYIFPNFQEGRVAISYRAVPLGEDGYPLIPSEEWWRNACTWEIAYRVSFKAFMAGKISDKVYQVIERDRDWYIAQAVNKTKMFTNDDEAQSFVNQQMSLIPRGTGHENFFRNISREQQIYNQPVRRW